jgi:drug/metabolite transporter (DMT)-like permease
MSWLLFAFSGPVLWAISMHLDKYLVERFFKNANPAVLLVFTAILGLAMLPIIWWFDPQVLAIAPWSGFLITASGLIFMVAMFLYFQALQSEEASVVAPFFQISPLFGYVLGYLVLGETLTGSQTLGGALIVGGTLMLSWRRRGDAKTFKTRLVVLMVASAFLLSLTALIFKFFAIRDEFWTTMFWTFVGHVVFGAGILAVGHYRRQFRILLRANTGALITINAANELVNLGGSLGTRYALVLAPLGLVQAVTSTTPLFVFIFGIALSIFLPAYGREELSAPKLAQKGLAAVVIGIGVILVGQ